ncbi:aminoacyl-tRNA hydrolase [Idiomarina tyrosinivorans]|uniref:Aminoacyl-tRNA hydrolase n=1 Tax=Idiomarina tyrosinivorans TaxID=1445662 RepID=A0A432ZQ03_9GAMM|nr:alternative ribosome rescue aminoacyl-tRNA hydrolase ArfB [Idiomarina tyrosinivorans]RUO79989.1 aminoacyl-tRNA hydrolase [Idiomarina tyrosinivorans]
MIEISQRVQIPDSEIDWQFIRASGAGGQHVNKVASAAQLIFDIRQSSLPEFYQQRLLNKVDHRITAAGKIIIKCQETRSQHDNKARALEQFVELVRSVTVQRKTRIATKPTKASQRRRVESKKQRGEKKALRKKPL